MTWTATGIVRDPLTGKAIVSKPTVKTYRLDTFAAGPTATAAADGTVSLTGLTDGVQYAAFADVREGRHIYVPLSFGSTGLITSAMIADGTIVSADVGAFNKASVTHNAAQSIANVTITTLQFNTDTITAVGITKGTGGAANSKLTVATAGFYIISGNVEFAASAVGDRLLIIRLNGATQIGYQVGSIRAFDNLAEINVCVGFQLAANDYVELVVYQTSGGALNVNSASTYSPTLSLVRVSA